MLVRGAVALARGFGVSPLVIGLTLVGFGTSVPELATSLQAALAGSPGIAIGNVVGSNTGNILLILGIAVLIAPIAVAPEALRRDGIAMVVASLACLAAILSGDIARLEGLVLLTGLCVYLAVTLATELRRRKSAACRCAQEGELLPARPAAPWRAGLILLAGLAVTLAGARLLVAGAISLAARLGMPEETIGLSIVAIGTSMPELATSVVAARRGHGDVALGNVIGSNIFNVLCILGLTALVRPLPVPASILRGDIWVMLAATALLMIFARTGWRVGRREGAVMVLGYGGYLAWLAASA